MPKKIIVRLFQNEKEKLAADNREMFVDKDNHLSIQNEQDSIPVLTLALDDKGRLMVNTNSRNHIKEVMKNRVQS